ncbi:hypothetical protein SAMN06295967_10574 [Belliella buryatensis]|uniref:Uncharacterized protein n=1 Tax=Belliella buryatensis TaxID=1500549 RepID=A0A239CIX5_9BACT|nr:hypothetical protein SAMN06295967_10574 [Belliella buryatensis]
MQFLLEKLYRYEYDLQVQIFAVPNIFMLKKK